MASKIKVDQIEGSTGSSITIPSGQTFTITDGLASSSLPTVPVAKGGTGLTSLGTAGQALKVNSGATGYEFGAVAGGKVLQVQYTAMLGGFAVSGTGLSDVTGYNVAITPSATSSKILVMANFSGQQGDYGGGFRLYRGTTFISSPTAASNRTLTHTSSYNAQGNATTTYSLCILDEPSTTSATTYKIVVNALSNTSYKVNESIDDSNSTDRPRTIATITAMEIGA